MKKNLLVFAVLTLSSASTFGQTSLTVTIENLQPAGGLFFTPVWAGFHDGSFDAFDVGGTASAAIEAIAEGGDTGPLSASFSGMGIDATIAPGTPFGPAGSSFASSTSASFSVDATANRYFSYASMIIPSNDAFIGNDSPTAFPLFDGSGSFTGPLVIDVFGANIYDAGTEMNIPAGGAAFSALGGTSTDEANSIAMHVGLDNFIGTGTANSETISSAFVADTPIARITIVPEPASFLLLGAALLGLCGSMRRSRREFVR